MSELYEKMDKILEKLPERRPSYFQLKHFVLGKHPTIQSQLWACLRELQTRKEIIDSIQDDIADSKDKLELLEIQELKIKTKIENSNDALTEKELQIEDRRLKRRKKKVAKSIKDLEQKLEYKNQEITFIVQYYETISEIEEMKDFDDLEVQKEYWNEKYTEEINLRILLRQPINTALAKDVLSLHEDSPVKMEFLNLLEKLKNAEQEKVKNFITDKLLEREKNV